MTIFIKLDLFYGLFRLPQNICKASFVMLCIFSKINTFGNLKKTNVFQDKYRQIIQFCTFAETNAGGNCCPLNSLNKEKISAKQLSEKKSHLYIFDTIPFIG